MISAAAQHQHQQLRDSHHDNSSHQLQQPHEFSLHSINNYSQPQQQRDTFHFHMRDQSAKLPPPNGHSTRPLPLPLSMQPNRSSDDPYGIVDFLDDQLAETVQSATSTSTATKPTRIETSFVPSHSNNRPFMQRPSPVRSSIHDHEFYNMPLEDSFSSSGSPTRATLSPTSSISSRHNSVDMDSSRPFGKSTLQSKEPPSPHFPTPGPAPLQCTGGGTASLTPALAAELTKAQVKLSQLKKQKDSLPPIGYVCRLCAIEGHWMENCILYKSNKHPQYNNAARAVALNIISPGSEVVLASLPVVSQPSVQYTPKFVAIQKQQQLYEQQLQRQHLQAQLEHERRQQQHQQSLRMRLYHEEQQQQLQYLRNQRLSLCNGSSKADERLLNGGISSSRFEQIWRNE